VNRNGDPPLEPKGWPAGLGLVESGSSSVVGPDKGEAIDGSYANRSGAVKSFPHANAVWLKEQISIGNRELDAAIDGSGSLDTLPDAAQQKHSTQMHSVSACTTRNLTGLNFFSIACPRQLGPFRLAIKHALNSRKNPES
jgi:hypothetical protein